MPTEEEIAELVRALAQELTGNDPMLQAAALADTVAILFVGHHPSIREEVIELWISTMRRLITANEEIVRDHCGDIWADALRTN